MDLIILALAAVVVGLCSGLFGIGGGTIVVPLLFFMLENGLMETSLPAEQIPQQVIFTSLAVVVCTSTISAISHWTRQATVIPQVVKLGGGLVPGCIIGSITLISVGGDVLKLILAAFFLTIAYSFGSDKNRFRWLDIRVAKLHLSFIGLFVGWLSIIMGIAGGMLNVGILRVHGLPLKKAVGTSAACGLIVSLTGVSMAMLLAWQQGENPLHYIHIPFFLSVALIAGIFTNAGARIAHAIDDKLLKRAFSAYMTIIGLYFALDAFGIVNFAN